MQYHNHIFDVNNSGLAWGFVTDSCQEQMKMVVIRFQEQIIRNIEFNPNLAS